MLFLSQYLACHPHQVSSLSVGNSTYLLWGTLAPPVPSFTCWSTCQPFLCATRSVIVLLRSQFLHNLLHVKLSYRLHGNHETTDVVCRFYYAPASFPVVRTVQWVLANGDHSLTYLDANALHDSLATHREGVGPLVQVSSHARWHWPWRWSFCHMADTRDSLRHHLVAPSDDAQCRLLQKNAGHSLDICEAFLSCGPSSACWEHSSH